MSKIITQHIFPLDLRFSEEVGPQKGSWKGGTIGTGCDMLPGETPEQAFRRYCEKLHSSKGNKYMIKFVRVVPQPILTPQQ